MSKYTRLPKQVVHNQPDEFVSTMDHLTRWFLNHKSTVIGVISLVVVASIIYFSIQKYQDSKISQINLALYKAEVIENEQDRNKAYEDILKEYQGQSLSVLAELKLLQEKLQSNDVDIKNVLSEFETYAKKYPSFLKPVLQLSLARMAWDSQDTEKALSLVDSLIQSKNHSYQVYAQLLKGDILDSMNKKDEAIKLYQFIVKEQHADKSVVAQAQARLNFMSVSMMESEK